MAQTEEDLSREALLDQPEIKHRELLEGLGAAILAIDLEGRFIFLNDLALKLFGYRRDEADQLIGQPFTRLLNAEQAAEAQDLFRKGSEMRPFVLEATRKGGAKVRVEVSGAWVRRLGRRVGALAMVWEVGAPQEAAVGRPRELTKLDLTILQLLAEGLSNREIAERVYLSRHTVKDRIEKIMRYFGVTRRAELAAKAARQGLV